MCGDECLQIALYSDDVRRTAYIVLAEKVDMSALSIAQRALVLHRGLLDRSSGVKKACQNMLDRCEIEKLAQKAL